MILCFNIGFGNEKKNQNLNSPNPHNILITGQLLGIYWKYFAEKGFDKTTLLFQSLNPKSFQPLNATISWVYVSIPSPWGNIDLRWVKLPLQCQIMAGTVKAMQAHWDGMFSQYHWTEWLDISLFWIIFLKHKLVVIAAHNCKLLYMSVLSHSAKLTVDL